MSILKRAKVEGLWDEKKVEITFDPSVNFLIGANGSGKTTVLNLIASALSSDFDGLSRNSFSRIECILSSPKNDTESRVSVVRLVDEFARISYQYTISSMRKPDIAFTLVNPSPRYLVSPSMHRVRSDASIIFEGEPSPLDEVVRVKWLTVHRAPSKVRNEERTASESSVDRRLTHLSNQLVRYFSKLATQREKETNRFLRQMLTAIVYSASEFIPFSNTKELNLPDVQASIEALMDTFLSPNSVEKLKGRLREHFELAAKANEEKDRYDLNELIALAAVVPMQKITEEWNSTQKKQDAIANPRKEFIEVINEMYKNKSLSLNQKNELEVDLPSGKHLSLSDLSSGEKQLLILFAEALLQEKSEFIYIADEPELSLHVTWQEQLTRNLLKINPKAQVIFATHSPDIVSQFGNKTIDMETLFR